MTNETNIEAQETALMLTKCVLQPLVEMANSELLTPSEQYLRMKEYINRLDKIISEGVNNDLRDK